jgi:hypothetical protein
MKCFDFMIEQIFEEYNDAEMYIEHALKYKETNRNLADALVQISSQELAHAGVLRSHLHKIVESSGHEMWQKVHEYMLPKYTEMEEKIRRMHEMYRM